MNIMLQPGGDPEALEVRILGEHCLDLQGAHVVGVGRFMGMQLRGGTDMQRKEVNGCWQAGGRGGTRAGHKSGGLLE